MPPVSSSSPDWYKFPLKDPPDGSADVASLQLYVPATTMVKANFPPTGNGSEEDYSTMNGTISYAIVIRLALAILSILCNLFIFFIILMKRSLRDCMANILLCHLSALGFSYTLLLVPSYTSLILTHKWYLDPVLCVFQGYMSQVLTTATLLTLAAISVEKYLTINEPLRYTTAVNWRKLAMFLLAIWLTSFLLSSLTAIITPGYIYTTSKASCDTDYIHFTSELARWILIPILVLTFYLPGGVLLFCYCRIFRIARGHRKRITAMLALATLSFPGAVTPRPRPAPATTASSPSKEQKASRTISVYLGSFFICYLPYSLLSILQTALSPLPINHHLIAAATSLYHAAPMINALVYAAMNKALRSCVLEVIKHALYSRHHVNQRNGTKEVLSTPLLSRAQLVITGDRRNSFLLAKVERLQREAGMVKAEMSGLTEVDEMQEEHSSSPDVMFIRCSENKGTHMNDVSL